jgi:hypothetical protein
VQTAWVRPLAAARAAARTGEVLAVVGARGEARSDLIDLSGKVTDPPWTTASSSVTSGSPS